MKSSDVLIDAIKQFEGCRLYAYRDSKGVPTIGIGHTRNVRMGQAITLQQAVSFLRSDLSVAEAQVDRLGVCRSQGQFDALVDFVYNVGIGSLLSSTLLKKIRSGSGTAEIQSQFMRWDKVTRTVRKVRTGKTEKVTEALPGLTKRRAWEAKRWAE